MTIINIRIKVEEPQLPPRTLTRRIKQVLTDEGLFSQDNMYDDVIEYEEPVIVERKWVEV